MRTRRLHNGRRLTVYWRARPGLAYHRHTTWEVGRLPQPRPDSSGPMQLLGLGDMGLGEAGFELQEERTRYHQLVLGWLEVRYRPRGV